MNTCLLCTSELGNLILNYDHVLLFGPTNAKSELHNFLNKDLHFKDIQIDVKTTDKMTDCLLYTSRCV